MLEIDGVVYLNGHEAAAYLGYSYMTFRAKRKELNLQEYKSKGQAKYYKKSDLDAVPRIQPAQNPQE